MRIQCDGSAHVAHNATDSDNVRLDFDLTRIGRHVAYDIGDNSCLMGLNRTGDVGLLNDFHPKFNSSKVRYHRMMSLNGELPAPVE